MIGHDVWKQTTTKKKNMRNVNITLSSKINKIVKYIKILTTKIDYYYYKWTF